MTNEEAIEILENGAWWDMVLILLPRDSTASAALHSAVDMGISALRAQQTPAKLDRSRWEGCTHCENRCCCTCKYSIASEAEYPCKECGAEERYDPQNFCPNCGRPLTEEAWAELERRINGGNDE